MSVTTPDTHEEDALPELPFPTTPVEEWARQLDKTARAKQLYPANSPSLQGAVDRLRAAFSALWQKTDLLVLDVSDTQLKWFGRTVWEQAEKGNDSLPWLLYKDGLRQFSIAKGFEGEDLPVFLDILGRIRMATAIDDDLLTLLWEHEWTTLKYRYVELASEGAAPLEAGATPGEWDTVEGEQRAEVGEAAAEAKQEAEQKGGIVRMEDFDSTLYFLDAGEIAFLQNQTKEEYELDLRHQVLNVLLDIFEMQPDPLVRAEIATNLEALTLHLLSATRYSTVAYLLRELPQTLQRARDVPPETHAKLEGLAARLSDPETLAQLIQALDESSSLPSAADLSELFGQLRPTALGTILAWVGQTQNGALRGLLEGAASRLAELNTGELVKLIGHEDEFVAVEAVRRSGALRTASAVPALTRALGEARK
ncbi:MAG: hypothetical protein K2X99_11595, partial [Gemmatimonadaceae bacterium]|nr:hypothetical protein [Gemmatimonadaceae bacterium]